MGLVLIQLNVCEHVKEETKRTHLFASAQCLGYRFEYGSKVTEQICRPSEKVIVKQIKRAVDKMSATVVFVATDKDTITEKIQKAIGKK